MAVGRRQVRWTCGQTDDLTSRKVSLTLLWSGSPEAPKISRGAMHSRAHRRWWRRARSLTPPPGHLSPAPVPGGASAQKTDAFPPPGPRTLDLVRLVRSGSAPSAPTAEAWRSELSGDCGPIRTPRPLPSLRAAVLPPHRVAAPDPAILLPRAGRASLTQRSSVHTLGFQSWLGVLLPPGDLSVLSPCRSVDLLWYLSVQVHPSHARQATAERDQ